jgi:hypothetical protein
VYALLEVGVPANARDPEHGGTALHAAAGRDGQTSSTCSSGGYRSTGARGTAPVRQPSGPAAHGSSRSPRAGGTEHLVIAKILVATGLRVEPGMADVASPALAAWLREQREAPVAERAFRRAGVRR